MERQIKSWRRDVKPGAKGYLGSTSGITPDGRSITLARFESEAAARANSERPEQVLGRIATPPARQIAFLAMTQECLPTSLGAQESHATACGLREGAGPLLLLDVHAANPEGR